MKIKKIRNGFTVEEYILLARRFAVNDGIKAEHSTNVIHWKRPYNPTESRLWFGIENLPEDLKNKDFYEHLVFANINNHLACYYLLSVDFKNIGLRKVNSRKTDKLLGGYADFFRADTPDYIRTVFNPVLNALNSGDDVYLGLIGDFKIPPLSAYENPDSFKGDLGIDVDDLKTVPDAGTPGELDEYLEFINWDAVEKTGPKE